MTQTLIRESVKDKPVKSGNRWRVVVARPGQGASGNYSAEVFQRDALKMLPKGAQSFINHDEKRDPKDMIGTYPEGGVWSEEDQAVVAELEVFSHWKSFVEELAPHVGISLYALGEQDEDGNVTGFIEDAYNGADLVSRPGLVGSGFDKKLYEAARAASATPSAVVAQEPRKDKQDMDNEKIVEALTALTAQVSALVSAETAKAEESAQKTADENAVAEALTAYETAIKAIDEADLLPSQVESLRAEAKRGVDIAPLIEAATKVVTEARQMAESDKNEGRFMGGSEASTFGAWK